MLNCHPAKRMTHLKRVNELARSKLKMQTKDHWAMSSGLSQNRCAASVELWQINQLTPLNSNLKLL